PAQDDGRGEGVGPRDLARTLPHAEDLLRGVLLQGFVKEGLGVAAGGRLRAGVHEALALVVGVVAHDVCEPARARLRSSTAWGNSLRASSSRLRWSSAVRCRRMALAAPTPPRPAPSPPTSSPARSPPR